jgi:hypothetical protein
MTGRFSASVAALLLAVACGDVPGSGGPPTAALGAWNDFPADQVPRPIVLLGIDAMPGQGFDSGGGKIAALCAKFALSTALPANVPKQAIASWADGTKVTYPVALTAAEALGAMTNNSARATMSQCASIAPLQVTAVRFDVATFPTDRGKAQMSAWLFTATGARAELAYPAIPTSAIWRGSITPQSSSNGATLSADGRSLTFFFVGAREGTGPCEAMYKGVVAEATAAVAIAYEAIPHEQTNGGGSCTAEGYRRSVAVTLASPLGGRVLVDSRGGPVPVCPEGSKTVC